MKFKLPHFLWLTSLIAGFFFCFTGFVSPHYIEAIGHSAGHEMHVDNHTTQNEIIKGWILGIKALGIMIILFGTLLFLSRKKLSNLTYTGIFAALMIISIVAASAVATFIKF